MCDENYVGMNLCGMDMLLDGIMVRLSRLRLAVKTRITVSNLNHTPQEIVKARRLLDEEHHSIQALGKRYLEAVRKCIYCDFSCDEDLNSEAMQSAVYTEVVCVLRDIKSQWESFFGV